MHEIEMGWISEGSSSKLTIPLTDSSPWCKLLGDWPLPAEGTIEEIENALQRHTRNQVTLSGCPAASLLVLLWVRSIWGRDHNTAIHLDISGIKHDEYANSQKAAAARLACLLADEVVGSTDSCGFFGPDESSTPEEAIDLMSYLMDAWDPNLHLAVLGEDWTSMMQRTLTQCAIDGHQRIGIYGAGTHTRSVGDALMAPESMICCIIDDDKRRHGELLWGYPIVSPEDALKLNLDAVVLSANSIEDKLWHQASPLRSAGVETIKIYGQETDT